MDLELEKKSLPWKHILTFIIEFGFLCNILLLDAVIVRIIFFSPAKRAASTTQVIEKTVYITPTTTPQTVPPPTLLQKTSSAQPTKQSTTLPQVKEYFVPLGAGQASSGDWQDVPGVQAYVDSTNYPHIKQTVFEVTVHVPNATENVEVRLFNETDKHPVWYSDISFPGTGTQFLISQPITLDSGNKLYSVQMKTQLQAPAVLDQARIHITLQ